MWTLAGRRLFSVGDTCYVWEDLLLAACLWGDWEALRRQVRAGLACLARLDDRDDDDEEALDEDEVDAAAEEFRYARDLGAAEDMEAWLERRGLTVDGWLDYIRRTLLVKQWAGDLGEIQQKYPVPNGQVDEVLVGDALCGGQAAALASRLAARAAIYAKTLDAAADGRDGVTSEEVRRVTNSLSADVRARGFPGLSPAACQARVEALARLEVAWQRFAAGLVTPRAIQDQIAAHQLDWIRFSVRSLFFRDNDAAREAALCVREDGRDLAEVAAEAGVDLEDADWYLDEVDDAFHDRLVGAQSGDLLGPLPLRDGHVVVSVVARHRPSAADAAVRARAERALLGSAVEREVVNRVTWHDAL